MYCTALLNSERVYVEVTQAHIYSAGHRDASGQWVTPILAFSESNGQVFMHETNMDALVNIETE